MTGHRIAGLSMPNWSLGVIGYIRMDEGALSRFVDELRLRCFASDLDLVKIHKSKRGCVVRMLTSTSFERAIILADPYGIANKLGTRYHVGRGVILDAIFQYLSRRLVERGFVSEGDVCHVDDELYAHLVRHLNVSRGVGADVARLIASVPEVSRVKDFRRGVFKLYDIEVFISVIDLTQEIELHVSERISRLLTS